MATNRLHPSPTTASYVHLRCLAAQLRRAVAPLEGRQLDVVDVGCGARPYEPLLAPVARRYVGVDWTARSGVDVVAPAEDLPFDDASFDVLLSSQVLEHVEDPAQVVREAARVLRPGGIALVSTHGVVNYHPNPDDFWRWTHTGLARLLHTNGTWSQVDVHANAGTASAIAYLIGRQMEAVGVKTGLLPALAPFTFGMNAAAWKLDRMYARRFPERPPDLCANYLAVAHRAAE